MKRKRPEGHSTVCIEEILESFSRRYKILARGQICLFRGDLESDDLKRPYKRLTFLVKLSSSSSTSMVKYITYLIVDLHYKNCLIERIPMLKKIF